MKRFLLSLCTLLMAVGSALADDTTVYVVDGTQNPKGTLGTVSGTTWTSLEAAGMAGLTVSGPSAYDQSTSYNARCMTIKPSAVNTVTTVTMTAPDGYLITGFAMNTRLWTGNCPYTVIVNGTSYNPSTGSDTNISSTGLNATTATFTMEATGSSLNWLVLKSWSVTVSPASSTVDVTYHVLNSSKTEVATSSPITSVVGVAPSLPSAVSRDYCTYTYYSDAACTSELATLTSSNTNVYVTFSYAPPFNVASAYASISDWYYLKLANSKYAIYASESEPNISLADSYTNLDDNAMWGFVGDPYSGVTIYNKSAGSESVLSSADPSTDDNTGGSTYAVVGNEEKNIWTPYSSTSYTNGFYLANADGYRLNLRSGKIAYWTEGYDSGSTFTISEVLSLDELKAAFKSAYSIDEENLGQLGYPTSDGKTTFEAAIDAITEGASFDTEAAAALEAYAATIVYPSGTYYIKNNNTGCYAYADDNTEAVTRINTDTEAAHTSNNYIWTVTNNGDNTFAINNLYGAGFTKADENSFTTESTTTVTTFYTNPFGDFAGKFYLEGAHNNNTYTTSDGTGYVVSWAYTTSSGSYWVFEEVDNSSLTTYSVTVTGVDASLDPVELSDGTVLNAGTATIYWSGTMTESDITQNEVTGFSIPETGAIVIDGTTVTITYAPSYETLMTNYMTENNIAAKLALAGSLGYPKTTTESYTNLNTLVTNIADNYNATGWANLKAYYAAYVDETDVVLPSTGSFYRIMGYATSKYAKTGTAGSAIPNSEGTATDGSDLWYYNTDNTLINYANGLGTIGTKFYADVEDTKETATFQHSTCTATSGVKFGLFEIISNYSGSKYWYSNTSNVDRNSANNNVNCEWVLTEVTSLPVTISTAKYASFYAPVAVSIPEGVTAYVATDEGDYLTLSAITDGIIPAGTGVILYADITEATTYSFSITTSEGSATSELTGSVATITKPVDAYYLSNGNSGIGFYKGGSATTLAGFKAYLEAAGGEVKTFRFKDVTGVDALKTAQQAGTIYDLSGRRVQRPVKGIFIQDGKKVVIK